MKMQKKLRQLEKEKEKRQKVRTAIKNGYRTFKMKFMIGKKRRKAQEGVDEEYLRETVLDKEYTKDAYKSVVAACGDPALGPNACVVGVAHPRGRGPDH